MADRLIDREQILSGYKTFCDRHTCEENCPYHLESEMRDISCACLYVLDKVEASLQARETKRPPVAEEAVCELMEIVRQLIDIHIGRRRGESEADFQTRKYDVLNRADELMGSVEAHCKE